LLIGPVDSVASNADSLALIVPNMVHFQLQVHLSMKYKVHAKCCMSTSVAEKPHAPMKGRILRNVITFLRHYTASRPGLQ
jgi:hypothetical protein